MSNQRILRLLTVYLLGVPFVTSINGLSMFLTGVSVLGPLYHTGFSLLLIGIGLFSRGVRKNWPVVLLAFSAFFLLVALQLSLGLSDFAALDLGIQYKWFMPLLLLAVYFRWDYWADSDARKRLAQLFRNIPLFYAALIILSFCTSMLFHFNPTAFEPGTKERFIGYSWGYNTTVNVFYICAYVPLVLLRTAAWRKVVYSIAFVLLLSKSAVLYFGLIGLSFILNSFPRVSARSKVLVSLAAIPLFACALWFGLNQTVRSAGQYASKADEATVTFDRLPELLAVGRVTWWAYVLDDATTWPLRNIVIGNGTNIDRRLATPAWQLALGNLYYSALKVDKGTKTLELDILGYFDLFGLMGAVIFGTVFYIYPLVAIRLPYFRGYWTMLTGLSLTTGHLLNNPQAATILVTLILFLKYLTPRRSALQPCVRTYSPLHAAPGI